MNVLDTITKNKLQDIIDLSVSYATILEKLNMRPSNKNTKLLKQKLELFCIYEIRRAPKLLDNVTDEEFIELWSSSISYAQVINKLRNYKGDTKKYSQSGSVNAKIKEYAFKIGLNSDHMLGQGHYRGVKKDSTYNYSLEEVLVENSFYNTVSLKNRLIKEGLLEYKCLWCENEGVWNGKEITLQIDHINGVYNDNRLKNLRILCPMCHSYTLTFRGRNSVVKENDHIIPQIDKSIQNEYGSLNQYCKECKSETLNGKLLCNDCFMKSLTEKDRTDILIKRIVNDRIKISTVYHTDGTCVITENIDKEWYVENKRKSKNKKLGEINTTNKRNKKLVLTYCIDCNAPISNKNKYRCIECYKKYQSRNVPEKEILISKLKETNANMTKTSQYFGVSTSALKKWCKKYNIPIKVKDIRKYLEELKDK